MTPGHKVRGEYSVLTGPQGKIRITLKMKQQSESERSKICVQCTHSRFVSLEACTV